MMRVLVDVKALEALCEAAEGKHRLLVNQVRTSVRAEPKAEVITKVADYTFVPDEAPVERSCTFAPRKRSAVSQSDI